MKKLNLFFKTFLFTFSLMGAMILTVHVLISLWLPPFYVKEKEATLTQHQATLTSLVQSLDEQAFVSTAKQYAHQSNLNLVLQVGKQVYDFQSFQIIPFDSTGEDTIVMPSEGGLIADVEALREFPNDGFYPSEQTLMLRTSIQTSFHQTATFYLSVDLQPVGEASGVVFKLLPYSIGASLLISLVASYFYARALTDPIRAICEQTHRMKQMQANAYCQVDSEDEIGELASNINRLYDTLGDTILSLEQEIQNVSRAETQKLDFLRSASHELKTPLTRLSIMLENMRLGIGRYKDRELYLQKCEDEVRRLSQMVQDILDTSRLQIGYQADRVEAIELRDWVLEVLKPYLLLANSKGIEVDVSLEASSVIWMDVTAISKALSNIISNAVNFTESGRTIRIWTQRTTLTIENECTPLSEEELSQVFHAFYRPDFSRTRHSGGNGLGLYIVKGLLTTHQIPYSFTATETGMKFELTFK